MRTAEAPRWRGFGFAELVKVMVRSRWRGFVIRASNCELGEAKSAPADEDLR